MKEERQAATPQTKESYRAKPRSIVASASAFGAVDAGSSPAGVTPYRANVDECNRKVENVSETYRAKRGEDMKNKENMSEPYRAKPHPLCSATSSPVYYAEDVERERAEAEKKLAEITSKHNELPSRKDLVEMLADLEHQQWLHWRLALERKFPEIGHSRLVDIPYEQLEEVEKQEDRVWAEKMLETIQVFYEQMTDGQSYDDGFLAGQKEAEVRVAFLEGQLKEWQESRDAHEKVCNAKQLNKLREKIKAWDEFAMTTEGVATSLHFYEEEELNEMGVEDLRKLLISNVKTGHELERFASRIRNEMREAVKE